MVEADETPANVPDPDPDPVADEEPKEEEPEAKDKLENLTPEFIENLEEVYNMFKE